MAGTKQQQAAVLGGLLLLMGAVYVRALRSGSFGESEPEAVAFQSKLSVNAPGGQDQAVQKTREAQRDLLARMEWGRDPFSRTTQKGVTEGAVLTGILWDSAQPIAIINGVMVRVGERAGDYQVNAIGHDSVSLSDGTETFQLHIAP